MTKPLSRKHQRFVDEYLQCFNATRAYLRVYPNSTYDAARKSAAVLLAKSNVSEEIDERMKESHMSADEALKLLADIGHSDQGVFWKIVDEWMFNPLPEYEILDQKEVLNEQKDPPVTEICYRVRHAVLDMDRILNPEYSWMIKSFSNSRKFGLKIETYDKHAAIRDVLKVHGKLVNRVEGPGEGGAFPIESKIDDERFDRAISSLADAIREGVSGKGNKTDGKVDTSE